MRDEADNPKKRGAPRKVTLALQGGGAHGAFTWGVLERLLDEEDLEVEGVTATSAGAMNGAMLTTGLKTGGRAEAKRRLETFWTAIRDASPLNKPPLSFLSGAPPFLGGMLGGAHSPEFNPAYVMGDVITRLISPYQFNPADVNPLRDILNELIDFSRVCRLDEPLLFVSATDVRSGRAKVFRGEEISVDALLASACLPFLYQAVTIEGREYWDGGYTGNPPIWPVIYYCKSEDVIVVHINPIERDEAPRDARGIQNRVNEISFNSNLMNEMRAIETIGRLIEQGVAPDRYKRMKIHAVEDQETMRTLGVATKLNPTAALLETLREAGHAAMCAWLAEHKAKLGVESSVDVRRKYL